MASRVLIFNTSFSPGDQISDYCGALGRALALRGVEVHLVCFDEAAKDFVQDGVNVHAVSFLLHLDNFFNWAMLMNNELKRRARELVDEGLRFDVVHANDWTTFPAALSIARLIETPLFVTFHSTEQGRGFGAQQSQVISDLEWWAGYEAKKLLVHDDATAASLVNDLKVPRNKIQVLPLNTDWPHQVLVAYNEVMR